MKRVLLSTVLIAIAASVLAVPAKRGVWKTVKLADGTEIRAELRGDEYANFWQAEDGSRYVKADGQQYFVKADMEKLRSKAFELRRQNPLPYQQSLSRVDIGGKHPDFIGQKKGLIVLVEFADKKFQPGHDAEYYSHVANDLNFSDADGHVGSIRDYFLAQSEGQFDLTFDVVGPVQLKYDCAYYGAEYNGYYDKNPAAMALEAVQGAVKEKGSLAAYDWFNDGMVDQVFVIYAGRGQADGGGEDCIWPHRSNLQFPRFLGGRYVSIYACSNELQSDGNGGEIIDGIGAFCHEFSHCLGLADLYDITYSETNYGFGDWDLMHGGCYLGRSFRPCNYSAYERMYCGWKTPIELTDDIDIKDLKGMSEGGDCYIIYNDAYKNEFYTVENRVQTNWDASLMSSGLLVSYIDFDPFIWSQNMVNTTSTPTVNDHERFTLFCADDARSVYDMAGDLYPCNRNNLLTDYSYPAAKLYHRNAAGEYFMNKPITNIVRNEDGTVSFSFRNEVGKEKEPLPSGMYFCETFNRCVGDGGNDGVWNPALANMSPLMFDNRGWEVSSGYGANQCAVIGTASKPGTATTPEFTIDGPCELHFKGSIFFGNGGNKLTLSVAKGDASLSATSFTLASKKWTDYTVKLSALSYPATCALTFKNNMRFCFIDDIMVMTEELAGIDEILYDKDTDRKIYTLDGLYVGQNQKALRKGVYIRNGKKIVVK